MDHRAHRNLAKALSPETSWKVIDDVNSIIDNPSQRDIMFNQIFSQYLPDPRDPRKSRYYNPLDIFHLGEKIPHRRVNHDPLTAAMAGTLEHGVTGGFLSTLHVMVDVIGEEWKKNMGGPDARFLEAQMNYFLEKGVIPQLMERQKMKNRALSSAAATTTRVSPFRKTNTKRQKDRRMTMSQNLTKAFYRR